MKSLACPGASVGLLATLALPSPLQSQASSAPKFAMLIFGGTGTISRSSVTPVVEKAYVDTLTIALRRGYDILSRGGSSLEASAAL